MTMDVIEFLNKMKYVFETIPDDEIDYYNDMENGKTEDFITYINNRYAELIEGNYN